MGAPNSLFGCALSNGQSWSLGDPNAAPGGKYLGVISENGRMVAGITARLDAFDAEQERKATDV